MARWLGECLLDPAPYDDSNDAVLHHSAPWPSAAWGADGKRFNAKLSSWPVKTEYQHLIDFIRYPMKPLSHRASSGFYKRAIESKLRFVDGFLPAVKAHTERMLKTETSRRCVGGN
jgi:DNA (cytosine-5)-methyltransferase 1